MNNRIFRIIKNFLTDRQMRFSYLAMLGLYDRMSDEKYLKKRFLMKMGKPLDLTNPRTFNEKIQWLKLYDRRPIYTKMADKYAAREIVSNAIGEEYLIPLLGTWTSFEEIDFDTLPNQFVLKCNHDSGGLAICRDKSSFDFIAAKKKIERSLKRNYFKSGREWSYKHIQPRIIAEKFLVDESGTELKDYKFFCFNGVVKAMFIGSERGSADGTKFDFFDPDFNRLPIWQHYENSPKTFYKPENYEQMLELSARLSKGCPHVRIDLYNVNGKIYFGEFTLYHFGGMERFKPEEWDRVFGDWLVLPKTEE